MKGGKHTRRHFRPAGALRHDRSRESTEPIGKLTSHPTGKFRENNNNAQQSQDGLEVFDDAPEIVPLDFSLLKESVHTAKPKHKNDTKIQKLLDYKDVPKKQNSKVIGSIKPTADRRSNLKGKNKIDGSISLSSKNREKVNPDMSLKKTQEKKSEHSSKIKMRYSKKPQMDHDQPMINYKTHQKTKGARSRKVISTKIYARN